MPLEIRCTNCGKTLRVGDQHAGKQVRCPACQQISVAPAAATSGSARAGSNWHMRTPEGQTFGPVDWQQLAAWVSEGRLAADCQVADSLAGPWRGATEYFPALAPIKPPLKPTPPPTTHDWLPPGAGGSDDSAPFAGSAYSPFAPGSPAGRYQTPHRGGLILILGLIGFALNCPIFCVMAWIMGAGDIREMRAGRMDPSGEGITQVGKILGMILTLLWLAGFVFFGLFILLAVLAGN